MTAGFNFNNYAAGFCSATPALRGNEVSMDTIDLGNSESLVCGVFPNQDGTFTAMTYTKSKTFSASLAGKKFRWVIWISTQSWKRLTKNTSKVLPKAKKLSASANLNRHFPVRQNLTADKRNSTARNQYAETRTRHHRARLYR